MYLTLHRISPRRRKARQVRRVAYVCLLLGIIPLAASAGLVAASRPGRTVAPPPAGCATRAAVNTP